jgi:hypothetical protein
MNCKSRSKALLGEAAGIDCATGGSPPWLGSGELQAEISSSKTTTANNVYESLLTNITNPYFSSRFFW